MNEVLIEHGTVISVSQGTAEVNVKEKIDCHECGAKMFCKPKKRNDVQTVTARDTIGVKPGDEVSISINGGAVMKAVALLYAVPIIILILGIVLGMMIFAQSFLKELFSFLLSAGALLLYYGVLYLSGKAKESNMRHAPVITEVRKPAV